MTIELDERQPTVEVVAAEKINDLHRRVQNNVIEIVERWIDIGERLEVERQRVGNDVWRLWVAANLRFDVKMALRYIRCAAYSGEMRSSAEAGEVVTRGGVSLGVRVVADMPVLANDRHPDAARELAMEMRQKGGSWADIARATGANHHAVRSWCDPDYREIRLARKRADKATKAKAREALAQREREAAIRKVGGNGADTYALLRKALAKSQATIDDTQHDDVRRAWREAQRRLLVAEEAVLDALRVEGGTT